MRYCLGFAFDNNHEHKRVLLIRKLKPAWQHGKLNGVGGKLEPGELAIDAMVREFREETTIATVQKDWRRVGNMRGPHQHDPDNWQVHVYAADITFTALLPRESPTDEQLTSIRVNELSWNPAVIPNLHWLIPLCLDNQIEPFNIQYQSSVQ